MIAGSLTGFQGVKIYFEVPRITIAKRQINLAARAIKLAKGQINLAMRAINLAKGQINLAMRGMNTAKGRINLLIRRSNSALSASVSQSGGTLTPSE